MVVDMVAHDVTASLVPLHQVMYEYVVVHVNNVGNKYITPGVVKHQASTAHEYRYPHGYWTYWIDPQAYGCSYHTRNHHQPVTRKLHLCWILLVLLSQNKHIFIFQPHFGVLGRSMRFEKGSLPRNPSISLQSFSKKLSFQKHPAAPSTVNSQCPLCQPQLAGSDFCWGFPWVELPQYTRSCHHEVGNHLGVPANLQVLTGNLGISHLKPEESAGKDVWILRVGMSSLTILKQWKKTQLSYAKQNHSRSNGTFSGCCCYVVCKDLSTHLSTYHFPACISQGSERPTRAVCLEAPKQTLPKTSPWQMEGSEKSENYYCTAFLCKEYCTIRNDDFIISLWRKNATNQLQ